LDGCYECVTENFNKSCAGCDGIPWSGLEFDYCGVCGGDNTGCCYSEDSFVDIKLLGLIASPVEVKVVTGQTVRFRNWDLTHDKYTVLLTNEESGSTRSLVVTSGNTNIIAFSERGVYTFTSDEFDVLEGRIIVEDFNRNTTVSGVCVRSLIVDSSSTTPQDSSSDSLSGAASLSNFFLELFLFVSKLFLGMF